MPDMWMDVDQALSEVPVNIMALIDDTDFKSIENAITYNESGMDLNWNFVDTSGNMTQTAVTPTTGGDYDWTNQGKGMYSIEIPASGGASINNDSEGFGWFTGICDGVLAWRGPTIGFRAQGLNDKLIDNAYSTTRGLAGTALPDATADAAGGLPISDAGGLDLDDILDQSLSTTEDNIRGADNDDLKDISDEIGSLNDFDPTTEQVEVSTNNDKTGYALSGAGIDAILDEVVEGTLTMRQVLRIFLSALSGETSGGGTNTLISYDLTGTKARVSLTVDVNKNRTNSVVDGT